MTSSAMQQLYQQIILDHAKSAHGSVADLPALDAGTATGASGTEVRLAQSHQVNTTCGDEVRLRVAVDGDTVTSVSWEGSGCSISQASVSVLADLVDGASLEHADETYDAFRALMNNRGAPLDEFQEDLLGDATAFVGVGKYPARIKCALLGWMALRDALIQTQITQTQKGQGDD